MKEGEISSIKAPLSGVSPLPILINCLTPEAGAKSIAEMNSLGISKAKQNRFKTEAKETALPWYL